MIPEQLSFRGVPIYTVFPSKDKFKRIRVPKEQYVQKSITWCSGFSAALLNIQESRYKKRKCVYATFYDEKQNIPFVLLLTKGSREAFLRSYKGIVGVRVNIHLALHNNEYVPVLRLFEALSREDKLRIARHHCAVCRQFRLKKNTAIMLLGSTK